LNCGYGYTNVEFIIPYPAFTLILTDTKGNAISEDNFNTIDAYITNGNEILYKNSGAFTFNGNCIGSTIDIRQNGNSVKSFVVSNIVQTETLMRTLTIILNTDANVTVS
jgi:hypothetical protein